MTRLFQCQQINGAYQTVHTATVISCQPIPHTTNTKKSSSASLVRQYECILDDTILFPAGGGQNHDVGYLQPIHTNTLIQCHNVERRTVDGIPTAVHTIDAFIEPNTTVSISVDWNRRYDHMQQHSTQHLISAIALNRYLMNTVSWHMASIHEPCYIIFDANNTVSNDVIGLLECDVNKQIQLHTPINLHIFDSFDSAKSLSTLRLGAQFDSNHSGELRVIEIENVDTNACCGTHLKNCSEIQSVVFTKIERVKGQIKLYFLAGHRVNTMLHQSIDHQTQLTNILSCAVDKHVGSAVRIQNELKSANKRINKLQSQLAVYSAGELLQQHQSNNNNKYNIIVKQYIDSNIMFLADVADHIYTQKKSNHDEQLPILVLTCTESDQDMKTGSILLYYMTANKQFNDTIDQWFKSCMSDELLSGRGGGKPGSKQGKVTRVDRIDSAVQQLNDALSKISLK